MGFAEVEVKRVSASLSPFGDKRVMVFAAPCDGDHWAVGRWSNRQRRKAIPQSSHDRDGSRPYVLTSIDPRWDMLVKFWSNGCTPGACGATPVQEENGNAAKSI
jgi:hypothetical protein